MEKEKILEVKNEEFPKQYIIFSSAKNKAIDCRRKVKSIKCFMKNHLSQEKHEK